MVVMDGNPAFWEEQDFEKKGIETKKVTLTNNFLLLLNYNIYIPSSGYLKKIHLTDWADDMGRGIQHPINISLLHKLSQRKSINWQIAEKIVHKDIWRLPWRLLIMTDC